MKVLALASYPIEAAATRYRLAQFVAPLAERGVAMTVRPFLDSQSFGALYRRTEWPRAVLGLMSASFGRLGDMARAGGTDVLLIQREAMIFGPPLFEWLATRACRLPMVLDLDDATYIPYTSPTYGYMASRLKWFTKTDDLIRWAKVVTCGNSSIVEYVEGKGKRAVEVPTVVDTKLFCPNYARQNDEAPVVLGWIGTHSTYPFLESIFPALQQLARTHRFTLRIIGANREIKLEGVDVESAEWQLEREIKDFQSFDIGLYPLIADEWAAGKSGFKAIQYMSVGIPYIVTPIGTCAEIGERDVTHFCASSQNQWHDALARLINDATLRERMGIAGRRHALQRYTVAAQADKLAHALHLAATS